MKPAAVTAMLFVLCMAAASAPAQQMPPSIQRITINAAIDTALQNNLQLNINKSEINKAGMAIKTAREIPKTGVFAENEDLRPSDKAGILKIGVSQSIAWPGLYKARKEYLSQQFRYYQLNTAALNAAIRKEVRTTYYELWYLQNRIQLFERLDSIYTSLFRAAALRVKTGEAAGLDRISAEAKMKELQAVLKQNRQQLLMQQQQLMLLLNINEYLLPPDEPLEKLSLETMSGDSLHPVLALQRQNINIAQSDIAVQQNTNKPEFSGRFFTQRLWGARNPFSGFSVTAAFPLFGKTAYKSKIKMAQAEVDVQQQQMTWQTSQLNAEKQQALTAINIKLSLLHFYETTGLKQADEIIKAASLSYTAGEISFAELSQFIGQAIDTKRNYLAVLNEYNQAMIQFNYYNNN